MPTLHTSEKTDPGVLPQPQALESASADNREGKDETGRGGQGNLATGVQQGRGESSRVLTSRENRNSDPEGRPKGEEARDLAAPPHITASRVFVLDRHGQPLMPCHPARARKLLRSGRARVHRLVPFAIRLVDREAEHSEVDGVEASLDPGSKYTGMSVFRNTPAGREGLVSIEIRHRGQAIHKAMQQRANYRRRRRTKNLRYRAPRWRNRSPEACVNCGRNAKHGSRYCGPCIKKRAFHDNGYRSHRLPPSLQHRIETTMSMVTRVRRWAPVVAIHIELVRFDMQKMVNPKIAGVEYQRGTLRGYEVREYLLYKYQHKCVYCGATGVPLNIEHIKAKANGGTNRVSNLALACVGCNEDKDNIDVIIWCIKRFGKKAGKEIAVRVVAQLQAPLTDASAVNSTRWALWRELKKIGLPVSVASGGRTKWNRHRFNIPKSHTLDALCVGKAKGVVSYPGNVIVAAATGRGQYARTKPDKYGFPRLRLPRIKTVDGFQTGDLVRAVVPEGKYAGVHVGRVAVRTSKSFKITTRKGVIQGVKRQYCTVIQRADGWGWSSQQEGVIDAK